MHAFGTFSGADGQAFPGLVVGDRVHDLRSEWPATLAMLEDWDSARARLAELAASPPGEGALLDELRPLAPIAPSGQILCGGANYHKHLHQMVFAHLRREGDTRPDDELRAEAIEVAARRKRDED